jgi:hypothetical protein
MSISVSRVLLVPALTLCFVFAFTGCEMPQLISGVSFNVEPNIETAKVQLNFGKDVHSDLSGSYPIKTYGMIEIDPWTPTTLFSVGFRANLDIVNDQDYVRLTPVSTLPAGQPLPITVNRAMAQVKMVNEINKNFDVYTYVDVVGKEWVGVAMTFKVISANFFPAGLSISQEFLKGTDGYSRAVATVFGPQVDGSGRTTVPGGLALFANVAALIKSRTTGGYSTQNIKLSGFDLGDKNYYFDGPMAPYYRQHPKEAAQAVEAFRILLNTKIHKGH